MAAAPQSKQPSSATPASGSPPRLAIIAPATSAAPATAQASASSSSKAAAKRAGKAPGGGTHVTKACSNCQKGHVACDNMRPCRRCVKLGKDDCVDGVQRKRGWRKGRARTNQRKGNNNNQANTQPAAEQDGLAASNLSDEDDEGSSGGITTPSGESSGSVEGSSSQAQRTSLNVMPMPSATAAVQSLHISASQSSYPSHSASSTHSFTYGSASSAVPYTSASQYASAPPYTSAPAQYSYPIEMYGNHMPQSIPNMPMANTLPSPHPKPPAELSFFILLISLEGSIFACSGDPLSVIGYQPSDLLSQNLYSFVHPEDYSVLFKVIELALMNPANPVVVLFRIRPKPGSKSLSEIWIEARGNVMINPNGKDYTMSFHCIQFQDDHHLDPSTVRRYQERLHLYMSVQHPHYQMAVKPDDHERPEFIVKHNGLGCVIDVIGPLEVLLGFQPGAFRGVPIFEIAEPLDAAIMRAANVKLLSGQQQECHLRIRLRTADNGYLWFDVYTSLKYCTPDGHSECRFQLVDPNVANHFMEPGLSCGH